ncbi:MAG: acetate/propionate family kinase [Thermoanaerobaculia bacterium]
MHILVINCGSSSIKAAIVDPREGDRVAACHVERIGESGVSLRLGDRQVDLGAAVADHGAALTLALPRLLEAAGDEVTLHGVGHRVVHGGPEFNRPRRITDAVVSELRRLEPLAPLHNPANVAGIDAARRLLPDLPHVAVFDTAFHATLPRRARTYALPEELRQKHGLRRYGFHGTSHGYIARRAAEYLESDVRDLRLITCHLGNGASVAAIDGGRSVETSMGTTPLEGLVMGTRSGDVDPGILLTLMREEGLGADALDDLLNRRSGLLGLSGTGSDMRDIEALAAAADDPARLAIQVFAHRVRKYVGAYAAVLGGVDAICFSAGIGENSATVRHRIAQRLDFLGARLDEQANRDARVDARKHPVAAISTPHSRCRLLVVATDEQHEIARQTAQLVLEHDRTAVKAPSIPIAVSARHVHLTPETVERLFGPGHRLTVDKPLSQPGQYAAAERVTLVGPRRSIERVRVLGPPRPANQVEISRTDEFHLGIDAPVRASGKLDGTPGITLVGDAGSVELEQGLICAQRHIHMTPEDAERFGVADRDLVEVEIDGPGRDLVFRDVLIRVKPTYKLEMHIDTDEANAAELAPRSEGALVDSGGAARLRRRSIDFDR